jgi:hypothetical protein
VIPEEITFAAPTRAWDPERAVEVRLQPATYPVVDLVDDNLGTGLVVRRPNGDDAVVDVGDIVEEVEG